MTMMMMLRCVSWLLLVVQVVASSSDVMSPIQNLEASLAASMAQSTTVAMKTKDDCVVLVYQSANGSTSKLLATPSKRKSFERNGLQLNPSRSSSRWAMLSPNSFCTMTGFSADVAHLTKVLARTVESHQAVYTQQLPIIKCVRSLSLVLQRAAQRDGARPYGIQALLVGLDEHGFQLYSCDPTGLYRHFSNGKTVIGKYGESIKKELGDRPADAAAAFQACLKAIVHASKKENFKLDSHTLEGLLLSKSAAGECEVAQIDSDFLEKCYREIQEQEDIATE